MSAGHSFSNQPGAPNAVPGLQRASGGELSPQSQGCESHLGVPAGELPT